ncbi:MAG: bile acid:sodium symporter family protein [Bacteroidia bacterium]|nr:bile acid:sodium symporter family protein [Bacteroidia bacterium]
MKILDNVRLNFSGGSLLLLNFTLAFIMFGLALEIKTENFKRIIAHPKSTLVGLGSQFVLLPALSFVLVCILHPTPSVALGMILVAACPSGNISNFISALAKGNVELSVSLTAIGLVLALFMTPFNFSFYGNLYREASSIIMPIEVSPFELFKTVVILLGVPLLLGKAFAQRFPGTTCRILKPVRLISLIIFACYILVALLSNFEYFKKYIGFVFLFVFLQDSLALFIGWAFARLMKLPGRDVRSVSIETGIKNSGLALVLIFNPRLFNGLGGMAFIAAWWGIWHMFSGVCLAWFWSKRPYRE